MLRRNCFFSHISDHNNPFASAKRLPDRRKYKVDIFLHLDDSGDNIYELNAEFESDGEDVYNIIGLELLPEKVDKEIQYQFSTDENLIYDRIEDWIEI